MSRSSSSSGAGERRRAAGSELDGVTHGAIPGVKLARRTEAVWDLAEGRSIFVLEDAERAGHALHTIFVDDLDSLVSKIASRDISPAERETYSNGVRKAIYRDADGNEIGFGDAPAERPA